MEKRTQSIEVLKQIFNDKEEVLQLLDPRKTSLKAIEGEQMAELYRNYEIFNSAVNLYVTGRTSVGKTSLGNQLYGSKNLMRSTGNINCTDSLNYFTLKSNLRYFDMPGAGAGENFENINRAALCIRQVEDDSINRHVIKSFKLRNFTHSSNTRLFEEQEVQVEEWQGDENQYNSAPHICLYVAAPHIGISGDDVQYLKDLLITLKERFKKNICVFALNLHHTLDGSKRYDEEDIPEYKSMITDIFNEVFNAAPTIVTIDALVGTGIQDLTNEICKILPVNQLGILQSDLIPELKNITRKEIIKRFRTLVINIACRIATRKADEKSGENAIIYEAYLSIYIYALNTFFSDNNYSSFEEEIKKHALNSINSKKEDIIIEEPIFEEREKTVIIDVPNTEYRDEIVSVPSVRTVTKTRPHEPIFGFGWRDFLFGEVSYESSEIYYETRIVRVPVGGTKKETISLGKVTEIIGKQEKKVGEKYLQNGYEFIEGICAIALGIESNFLTNSEDNSFDTVYKKGYNIFLKEIGNNKQLINQILENEPISEKELLKLLNTIFVTPLL